jgi:hypothetical protein
VGEIGPARPRSGVVPSAGDDEGDDAHLAGRLVNGCFPAN